MDSGLAALLSAAATTLVTSMTTDSWKQVKVAFVSLWRRRPEQAKAVSADLADARSEVIAAQTSGDEHAQADLVTEWASRLRRLITDDGELQDELKRFAEEFRHLLGGQDDASQIVMRAEVHGPALSAR